VTPEIVSVAVLLALLQIKHVIADYVLQGRYILDNRHKWGHPGGLLHVAIHALGSLAALVAVGTTATLTLVMLLAEAVVHCHIDWAKDGLNRRIGATPDRRAFWVLAGTDQGLHQLTYVGMAVWWAAAMG
jgi:hypothetical protein